MPEPVMVDVDEVLDKRKDVSDDNGVLYKAHVSPRSWNDEERSAIFVMSAEAEDSYRDIVVQDGIDLEARFNANPVALFGHRSWDMPVGTWSDIRKVRSSPKRTEGKLTFTEEGVDDVADRTARNVKAGVLKASSIGFRPKMTEKIRDAEGNWTFGYKFMEVELYECSVVTIPAVRQALIKGAGANKDIIEPEVIEEFLEHLKKNSALAQMVNKDLFGEVYREITGNKTISTLSLKLDGENVPKIELGDMTEFRGLVERMEKAAGIEPPATDDVDEADIDTLLDDALKDVDWKAEDIPEDKREGFVKGLMQRVRKMFGAEEETTETTEPAPKPEEIEKSRALYRELGEILKAGDAA